MTSARLIQAPPRASSSTNTGVLEEATAPVLVALFIASIIAPVFFNVAGLVLSMSRLVLLLLFVPLALRLLSGRAGKLLLADYFFILYGFWIFVSLTYNHGLSRFALSGITIIEHFGAYLVGRVLIRNVRDYKNFIRVFFISMLILFPFALIEFNTNINYWSKLWGIVFDVAVKGRSASGRLGFERVQSGFEHPIHFGMYCAVGVANFFYIYRNRLARALPMMGFSTFMSFMSISSGPLLAIALQIILILWDQITRGKWKILVIISIILYVTIDSLSNRTPVTILISTLTFNTGSAWTRISIWNFGIAAVWRSPFFGIGLNDWPRPFWLTPSVDNFWLLTMMRHGMVALFFLASGIIFGLRAILRAKNLSADANSIRTGYVITVVALLFSLSTVHIWGSAGSFVMFYFGAGMWLCTAGSSMQEEPPLASVRNHRGVNLREEFNDPSMAGRSAGSQDLPSPGRGLPRTRFANVHKRDADK